MNNLDRIDGAIIGLQDLKERLERIKEREKKEYFYVSSGWVDGFIESHINIYRKIKIKALEKEVKKHEA